MSCIVACYKWVADEAELKINADLSVDINIAKGKISNYDRNAIQASVLAAEASGNKSVCLTFGTEAVKPSFKDALSRGPEEAYWVNAEQVENADSTLTSKALASAVQKINDVSLVICAEGASDTYARQIAPRIGAILDWPVVTSVCKIELEGNNVTLVRKLDDCMETVKVSLPAVIAVLPEVNEAPIPGLKAVLAAGKKPITELKLSELGIPTAPKSTVTSLKGYSTNRKNVILGGSSEEKVSQLVVVLKKEGVL